MRSTRGSSFFTSRSLLVPKIFAIKELINAFSFKYLPADRLGQNRVFAGPGGHTPHH
jgi:hypothetical protein